MLEGFVWHVWWFIGFYVWRFNVFVANEETFVSLLD